MSTKIQKSPNNNTQTLPPFPLWKEETMQELKIHTLSFCSGDDLLRLAKVCKSFSRLVSLNTVWENFAKKKGITLMLPPDSSAKKRVLKYVKIFTSLFPESAVKPQTEHSLEERWQMISTFARSNSDKLLEKFSRTYGNSQILAILEATPPDIQFIKADMEKAGDHWKLYVERGFPTTEAEMLSILDLEPQMYQLLGREYFCLLFVLEIKSVRGKNFQFPDAVIKKALEKHFTDTARLMITKQKARSVLFQHTIEHFSSENFRKICSHFLSLGYEFSKKDLQAFLKKEWHGYGEDAITIEQFEEMVDRILTSKNLYANSTDIKWVMNPDSYFGCYESLCPKVLQKVVDLSANLPTTEMFQSSLTQYFSPRIVDIFLKKGYKITSSDFRFVIDKLIEPKKERSVPWMSYTSDPDHNVLLQLISQEKFDACKIVMDEKYPIQGGQFKPTREDFHYLLEKRPVMMLVEKILKNGYLVNSEDFKKAIDHVDFLMIRELFQADRYNFYPEDAYMPTQDDFHYALKKNDSWCKIAEIIRRGYQVKQEDFIYALDNKCSEKTIGVLLNDGYHLEKDYSETYRTFGHDNFGYKPSQDDYQHAKTLCCSNEILEMMKKRNKKLSK